MHFSLSGLCHKRISSTIYRGVIRRVVPKLCALECLWASKYGPCWHDIVILVTLSYWLHRKLSLRQLSVQWLTKISPKNDVSSGLDILWNLAAQQATGPLNSWRCPPLNVILPDLIFSPKSVKYQEFYHFQIAPRASRCCLRQHCNDVTMTAMASSHRILGCWLSRMFRRTSKKYQGCASRTFVGRIHQWPVDSPRKGPVTRKLFPFDDVIMG